MKDTAVQKQASLHEKAVQAVATGELESPSSRGGFSPKTSRTRRIPALDYHAIAHPLAIAAAQEIMRENPSYTKVEYVDDDTVMVR